MKYDKTKFEFINDLSKKLSKYENERKQNIKVLIISEFITFVILFVLAIITLSFINYFGFLNHISILLIIGVGFCIFLLIAFPSYFNGEIKIKMKNICKPEIEEAFNIRFEKSIDDADIKRLLQSDLFSKFNICNADDVFHGVYNNVVYKLAEINLKLKDDKHCFPVFSGIFIELPFNKEIKAKTIVTSKSDTNKRNQIPVSYILFALLIILAPYTICILQKQTFHEIITGTFPITLIMIICVICYYFVEIRKPLKISNAKLESVSFEKRFVVQTEDQVEGRYLVTPAFMERLLDIQTSFGTSNIKCAFFEDKLLIAISSTKDLFEICDLYKPLGEGNIISQFYDEITSIENMIDHFKLNEKTGL